MLVYWLNMFRALVCPSSGVQQWVPLSGVQTCKPSGLCSAGLLEVCTAQRMWRSNSPAQHNPEGLHVWTPESGTHYFITDDGHTGAQNMLSQTTILSHLVGLYLTYCLNSFEDVWLNFGNALFTLLVGRSWCFKFRVNLSQSSCTIISTFVCHSTLSKGKVRSVTCFEDPEGGVEV
jgi:hypothetical protein